MLFGTGLAFFFGKPYIQPEAPRLQSLALGAWSAVPQVRAALQINPLFFIGIALAVLLAWALQRTRWGLVVRMCGDSAAATRSAGYSVDAVRLAVTAFGGFLAGVGGAFLSLSYPGSWSEGLSSGAGHDGRGARDLRALESARVRRRSAAVRRGRGDRAGVADGRHHRRLLLLQRGAVSVDARVSDRVVVA